MQRNSKGRSQRAIYWKKRKMRMYAWLERGENMEDSTKHGNLSSKNRKACRRIGKKRLRKRVKQETIRRLINME